MAETAQNGGVRMLDRATGKVHIIPPEKVAEAHLHGLEPVLRMETAQGKQHWIPISKAVEAQANGLRAVQQDGKEYAPGTEPVITGVNSAGQPQWGTGPKYLGRNEAGFPIYEHTPEKPGFLESAADAVGGAAKGAVHMLDVNPTEEERRKGLTSPVDYALRPVERLVEPQLEQLEEGVDEGKKGNVSLALGHGLAAVTPLVGPMAAQAAEKSAEQIAEGNSAGALGTLAGTAAVAAAPEGIPATLRAGADLGEGRVAEFQAPRSRLDAPIGPGEPSPADRFRAAGRMGVNLDRAQATNSPLPRLIKLINERSLGAGGRYTDNLASNVEALHSHAGTMLDAAHPNAVPREQFGSAVQARLKAHKATLADEPGQRASAQNLLDSIHPTEMSREQYGNAVRDAMAEHRKVLDDKTTKLYEKLDSRLGNKMPNLKDVRDSAQGIYNANKRFYGDHSELMTGGDKRVWAIIQDFARGAEKTPATTWADLQRTRSHLLDLSRSPEFTGDLATGWVKQLTGAIDRTMTSGERTKGLTGRDMRDFREANQTYKTLKNTYDNNQSPFYWIARDGGLKSADRVNSLDPAGARQFKDMMTEAKRPDIVQQQQRQFVSRILDPQGNGAADLEGLPARWNKAPKEMVQGVLNPSHMIDLGNLADRASKKTIYDTPGSQLKQIVEAPDGTTAGEKMFSPSGKLLLTPEEVRQIDQVDPDLTAQLRRQAISRLFDPNENGTVDLRNFSSRWNRTNKDALSGVLTPDQMKEMNDFGSVAKVIHENANPSGTSAVLQPAGEMSTAVGGASGATFAGHPLAGAGIAAAGAGKVAADAAIAKRMTNPEATAAVVEHPQPPPLIPATIAAGATALGETAKNIVPSALKAAPAVNQNPQKPEVKPAMEPAPVPQTGGARPVLAEGADQVQLGNRMDVRNAGTDPKEMNIALPSPAQPAQIVPTGATHEVLHEDGKTVLGHVVGGEYVPLPQ